MPMNPHLPLWAPTPGNCKTAVTHIATEMTSTTMTASAVMITHKPATPIMTIPLPAHLSALEPIPIENMCNVALCNWVDKDGPMIVPPIHSLYRTHHYHARYIRRVRGTRRIVQQAYVTTLCRITTSPPSSSPSPSSSPGTSATAASTTSGSQPQ